MNPDGALLLVSACGYVGAKRVEAVVDSVLETGPLLGGSASPRIFHDDIPLTFHTEDPSDSGTLRLFPTDFSRTYYY